MEKKSYTISQYNTSIRRLLKERVPTLWIQGVISQFQIRGNVVYFSLTEYETGSEKPISTIALFMYSRDYYYLLDQWKERG